MSALQRITQQGGGDRPAETGARPIIARAGADASAVALGGFAKSKNRSRSRVLRLDKHPPEPVASGRLSRGRFPGPDPHPAQLRQWNRRESVSLQLVVSLP